MSTRQISMPRSNEAALWRRVKLCLGYSTEHDVQRVENTVGGDGYPDVNYCLDGCEGHVELKVAPRGWPKRATTVVKVRHFTSAQRGWLVRRGQCGGRAYLLLQVENDFLLFDWVAAAGVGLAWAKAELYRHARRTWHEVIDGRELAQELKRR